MNESSPPHGNELSGIEACECWKCHKPTPRLSKGTRRDAGKCGCYSPSDYCVWCGNFLLSTTKAMTAEEAKARLDVRTRDGSTQSDLAKEEPPMRAEERHGGVPPEESTKKQRVDE